jgi:glucarate dehydratase
MRIERVEATEVFIPYDAPVGPYAGRRGATQGATGLIVRVETDANIVGWGEGHGALDVDPIPSLRGRDVTDVEGALAAMGQAGMSRGPTSGIEMALWDAVGKHAGLPLCGLLGGVLREEVDFCGCMGIKEAARSAATAREYMDRWGFRYIKTKAGDDPEQDLAIAEAIQREIGDGAVLRPDANSGYDIETTERVLRAMSALGVRYFEDPCPSDQVEDLRRFRETTDIAILVNMGVETPDTVLPLLANEAVDVVMPDFPNAGGILPVRKIAAIAEAYGIPCLMHCSHDLGLKTAAVTYVAAATPNFSGPNDTCYHGLSDDILTDSLTFERGRIRVPTNPGLGVEVDEAKLARYAR